MCIYTHIYSHTHRIIYHLNIGKAQMETLDLRLTVKSKGTLGIFPVWTEGLTLHVWNTDENAELKEKNAQ